MALDRRRASLLALALLAALAAPGGAAERTTAAAPAPPAFPGCASDPDHPAGDWRHYGMGLDNSRNQWSEKTISAANAGDLSAAWAWEAADEGLGVIYSTPIVHKGCLFMTTSAGYVVVRNADTGALVWRTQTPLEGNSTSLIGGVLTGSAAVDDEGWIYLGVSRTGKPYSTAFRPDGRGGWVQAWATTVDTTPNSLIVTGPLLYTVPGVDGAPDRPLLFQGISGAENTATARGGYALLDPRTGRVEAKGYTIDDAGYAAGFRGASIWGQSAIDTDELYVYAPTGNPASKKKEHKHANAVVKIDADPGRATFGQIVDHYKGTPDNYVEQVDVYNNPVCQSPLGDLGVIWGQVCLQLDLDFGAPPNLWRTADGTPVVGAWQKSGVYHLFRRDTMDRVRTATIGAPAFPVNAAAPAYDAQRVYVNSQPPGQLIALNRADLSVAWVHPLADGYSFLPVTVANGVVYITERTGNFKAIDAASGLLLGAWNMTQELGTITAGGESSGIAVARGTVYVAIGDALLAYRLPARAGARS